MEKAFCLKKLSSTNSWKNYRKDQSERDKLLNKITKATHFHLKEEAQVLLLNLLNLALDEG